MDKDTTKELDNYFAQYKLLTFTKGSTIIFSEDEPGGVYYLRKGYIKMNTITADGNELTLNIYKPGSFFPMFWALGDIPNQYTFQAMTNVSLNKSLKIEFNEFLQSKPTILFDLTKRIMRGNDALINNLTHFLVGNAEQRVAATLLMVAKRFGEDPNKDGVAISLSLTHQDIANLAGITRETTTVVMGRLVKQKIIKQIKRKIIVTDIDGLADEAFIDNNE
jgi:CRP/FNR family cyclic AMP-dependent transcriptional regulator